MKVYHDGDEVSTPADIEYLAQVYDIPPEIVDDIVESIKLGEPAIPTDYPEDDQPGICELLGELSGDSPGQDTGRSQSGEVRDVEVAVDFDQQAMVAVTQTQIDLLGDHFHLEDGQWKIRPDSPPSLEQAYQAAAQAVRLKNTAVAVGDYADWTIGNMIAICEEQFGEDFNISQLVRNGVGSYAYLNNVLYTFKFTQKHGKRKLCMTSHVEVVRRSMEDSEKNEILDFAEHHQLSARDCRKIANHVASGGSVSEFTDKPTNEVLEMLDDTRKTQTWAFWRDGVPFIEALPVGKFPKNDFAINISGRMAYVGRRATKLYRHVDYWGGAEYDEPPKRN